MGSFLGCGQRGLGGGLIAATYMVGNLFNFLFPEPLRNIMRKEHLVAKAFTYNLKCHRSWGLLEVAKSLEKAGWTRRVLNKIPFLGYLNFFQTPTRDNTETGLPIRVGSHARKCLAPASRCPRFPGGPGWSGDFAAKALARLAENRPLVTDYTHGALDSLVSVRRGALVLMRH